MEGNIVYRYLSNPDTLYLNIIGRFACLNKCLFCGKPDKDDDYSYPENVYGKGLYLSESPNIETILKNIKSNIRSSDKVLSFVGLGEPLLYFPKVLKVLRELKANYNIKTNVDTCGLVEPFFPNAIERLDNAGLDTIYISLNATDNNEYKQLCQPKIDNAFEHLITFIKKANQSKIKTFVSFILNFESKQVKTKPKEEYLNFALSLGLKKEQIKWRNYMPID